VRCDDAPMLRAAFLSLAILLTACASQQVVDRFDSVTIGMTKDEVVALLGKPSSRWTLSQKSDGMVGERLQWGDGLSSLASSALYRGKPDRAYCVDFDEAGKVVSKAAPVWIEEQEERTDQ
jgi:hypothetical protein